MPLINNDRAGRIIVRIGVACAAVGVIGAIAAVAVLIIAVTRRP
jgi:hypothetical protein